MKIFPFFLCRLKINYYLCSTENLTIKNKQKNMRLLHIAYYNDIEDLKTLADKSADEIVEYAKNGYGALISIDSFDACIYTKDDFEGGILQFTTNGKYAVTNDLPIDINLLGQTNVCDFFIDIYEVIEDNEDCSTEKLCAKNAVSGQIVNMLINNIINKYGNETFEGWCENGAVFETSYPNATKEFIEACEELMKKVAPLVDDLTYNYLAN